MGSIRDFYQIHTAHPSTGLKKIISFVPVRAGGVLLDIGCFDGSKTTLFKNAALAETAWGVDFANERMDEARQRGIQILDADLNNDLPLALPEASIDVITCVEVIEHVYSPDDLLDEIVRLLKPDGCLILTTPNLASWKNRFVMALGLQPFLSEVSTRAYYGNPFMERGMPVGHIRLFTLKALLELSAACGLRPTRVGGIALTSPMNTLLGSLSRAGDSLLTRFPSMADRFVIRFEKISHP